MVVEEGAEVMRMDSRGGGRKRNQGGELSAPLFTLDHDEEVMRLRLEAEKELMEAEEEAGEGGGDEDEDGDGREMTRGGGDGDGQHEEEEEEEDGEITDKGIREVWRARERQIAKALDPSPPRFPPAPIRPASASSDASGTVRPISASSMASVPMGDAEDRKEAKRGGGRRAGAATEGGGGGKEEVRLRGRKAEWRSKWGADGVEEHSDDGWGSDLSSQGEANAYVPEPETDPFATPHPPESVAGAGARGGGGEEEGDERDEVAALAVEAARMEKEAKHRETRPLVSCPMCSLCLVLSPES